MHEGDSLSDASSGFEPRTSSFAQRRAAARRRASFVEPDELFVSGRDESPRSDALEPDMRARRHATEGERRATSEPCDRDPHDLFVFFGLFVALYRLGRRWWESRFGRRARAVGAPVIIGVCLLAGLAAFPPTRDAVVEAGRSMYAAAVSRPEFRIEQVAIIGADRVSHAEIVGALDLKEDQRAAFAIDAEAARTRIEALGWVDKASVSLRPPQTLQIEVHERQPALLWRINGELQLLDAAGAKIASPDARAAWPGLPLIVGRGADVERAEAIALDRAARLAGLPILGLTRIGDRRWDLELVDGPRILLPEDKPFEALTRVVGWIESHDLMNRAISRIDLRVPHAPTVRYAPRYPTPQALAASLRQSG